MQTEKRCIEYIMLRKLVLFCSKQPLSFCTR